MSGEQLLEEKLLHFIYFKSGHASLRMICVYGPETASLLGARHTRKHANMVICSCLWVLSQEISWAYI